MDLLDTEMAINVNLCRNMHVIRIDAQIDNQKKLSVCLGGPKSI